ncbi:MAG TPA: hypothetical protein VFQ53_20015 [Kofleriaceae bacterium]|nr:hypothetical protein [Kofleriaceae bacterium]
MFGAWIVAAGITVYAAGGTKRTAEKCNDDSECSRGHCYQKQNGDKVCVDCSSSEISDYRGQIQRFCKDEPTGCTSIPNTAEVSDEYFKIRVDNNDRCIAARKNENSRCWDGGDQGHKDAVEVSERTKTNCMNEWNTRKGNGGIYECSTSTYESRSKDADDACTSSVEKLCDGWSKDDKVVECNKIEDAMKEANKCVTAVERLDSDCLPRLSRNRENQFARGKKAYDACKEILDYKKGKSLCK